jgi:transposase-like protein
MQKSKSHPESFKGDAVRRRLARGSKSVDEIARELGVSSSMIHRWRQRFEPELTGSTQPRQGDARRLSDHAVSCAT